MIKQIIASILSICQSVLAVWSKQKLNDDFYNSEKSKKQTELNNNYNKMIQEAHKTGNSDKIRKSLGD